MGLHFPHLFFYCQVRGNRYFDIYCQFQLQLNFCCPCVTPGLGNFNNPCLYSVPASATYTSSFSIGAQHKFPIWLSQSCGMCTHFPEPWNVQLFTHITRRYILNESFFLSSSAFQSCLPQDPSHHFPQ